MKLKKVYLYLCGGLGNQLFQYAAAKNIAINNNAKVIIDSKTGFYTDFRDYWRFSLNKKKLSEISYNNLNLIFIIFRILNKFFQIRKTFIFFFNSIFINESKEKNFLKKIADYKFKNKLYLLGYFQSDKYFLKNKKKILNEIIPPIPKNKIFINIAKKIHASNSVAIGLRFHETMPKNIQYKIGGITPINFYVSAIKKIIKKKKNPVFFIFSTKNENIYKLFNKINIKKKYKIYIITEENGFIGSAMDNLWLISQCKNFIFSNSTFYWWGCYFSKNIFNRNIKQTVYCSDNFPNDDTCLKHWSFRNY